MAEPPSAAGLAHILALDAVGDGDVWHAHTPTGGRRPDIYGGQVAGQALLAAARTVERAYLPNSVHCYFLRRGDPEAPLEITVGRTRTGRTYASRSVNVRQDGRSIFTMLASFHTDEPSPEFDHPMAADVPDPDTLPRRSPAHQDWRGVLDMRVVPSSDSVGRWWCRIEPGYPTDATMQLAALLYVSDMRAGITARAAIGYGSLAAIDDEAEQAARAAVPGNFGSLDHSVWFHRVPSVTEWLYCEARPMTVRDSRGLVMGTIFDRDGRHLATFTQEVFLKAGVAQEPDPVG